MSVSKIEVIESSISAQRSGLTTDEVLRNQKEYGLNTIHNRRVNVFSIFLRQITGNPLTIILALATLLSFFLGQRASSYYIFGIIMLSILLGVWNEYSAEKTIDNLLKKISSSALVIRNGQKQEIPVVDVTIGDIILLSQGSIIPADLKLLEANRLEANESALTGEAKTVYKAVSAKAFMGTSIDSGSGIGQVIAIGKNTEFGKIAKSATFVKPITEFQKGLSKFGNLIVKTIIILTVIIFAVNYFLGHNVLESALFALAIAVGLTPELLPVIVTVSLSHGAGKLAKKHVVVKKLLSLENLGNMDVLCTDKTGTLTEGKIDVVDYINPKGNKDEHVLQMALLANTAIVHHKVIGNSIDVALWEHAIKSKIDFDKTQKKIHEEDFDYNRKAGYTVVRNAKSLELIAKGSPEAILALCKNVVDSGKLNAKILALRKDGLRIVLVAAKSIKEKEKYSWDDVKDLSFAGLITFLDIPQKSAGLAISQLRNLNVATKVITGDNEIVTRKICAEVEMNADRIITGLQMQKLSDQELKKIVNETDIFAQVSPLQKLQIIKALQDNGHVVGFLGDGINDLPALHNADIGISVNSAVDVAKDAASVVLLRKSLEVIHDGIREGRKTFNNTIKYILMSTSSNFGNMFSAAGASFFLPFLPMTPVQILLTNTLYDVSQLSIPSDNVDHESLVKPRHWNINFIKDYMLFFGPISSIYDFLTFSIMIFVFHARGILFQTGWFIESLATEILVVFVIRTAKTPFYKSTPSIWLTLTSLGIVGIGVLLPFTPLAKQLGFVAPPPLYFIILVILTVTYLFLVEVVKTMFLKKYSL